MNKKNIVKVSGLTLGVIIIAFVSLISVRKGQFKNETEAMELTVNQIAELQNSVISSYGQRLQTLQPLPYNITAPALQIGAKSAILIDAANGNVLYEKNADEIIPPASMTKLFSMYVVDEEVSAGRLSYDQVIPLPPESWACNMPPHSSLMFLGEGQVVTLDELLLGLSICSGNDAAYALAYTICGNMEDFVARMNQVAEECGLVNTHFVESSGYSELNTTTAREMATFCKIYLQRHPDSLKKYHSVSSFTYPKKKNLAPGDVLQSQDFSHGLPRHITMSITQENTNPLLGRLPGCDGLKTGYIDESGYNLALTARRGVTRFLSVTMGGQGSNAREGQAGRVADGTTLMEWAFGKFSDYYYLKDVQPYFVKLYGAKKCRSLNLVPAFPVEAVTIPYVIGDSLDENMTHVKVIVDVPHYVSGGVTVGQVFGSVKIQLDGYLLDEIPLIADRTVPVAGLFMSIVDNLIK